VTGCHPRREGGRAGGGLTEWEEKHPYGKHSGNFTIYVRAGLIWRVCAPSFMKVE